MKCCDCGSSELVALEIGLCKSCIKSARPSRLLKPHVKVRSSLGMPTSPPNSGIPCGLCSNECRILEGGWGYCGLRRNQGGKLHHIAGRGGLAHTYYDPLPTNCCAAWFCHCRGGYNLAVFYYGCNFDCLFCQNAHHKYISDGETIKVDEFVKRALRPYVKCICHFGGSPEPQLPFALLASKASFDEAQKLSREMRICWEWNGCGEPELVRRAAELSLRSGGVVKFDLKAWNERLSLALSGVPNQRAFENFEMIAKEYLPQAKHHLLTATTLLVPGYVDEDEVRKIAEFIANINLEIPYSLLIFHGAFVMADLPITPRSQVINCYKAAKEAGLKKVHVGNLHLLGPSMREFSKNNL